MDLHAIILTLPIVLPLAAATVGLIAWRSRVVVDTAAIAGMVGLLGAAVWLLTYVLQHGPVATQLAGWRAPVGITFVADGLSALMVLLTAVMGLAVAGYSLADLDGPRRRLGYFPLVLILTAGVCGAFLTGDLFNLFVWFEVLLIASFVLLALGGEKPQMEGALKYVTLNLISSAVFLTGLGLVYGTAHTLNMADLHRRLPEIAAQSDAAAAVVDGAAMLFLVSFGIKSAVIPLGFWLPASYPTPPAAVSALFAGLLTKVGVYSLIRATTLIFPVADEVFAVILVVGCVTMIVGVLGAVAQFEFRKILAFHSISQIGYMVTALGLLVYVDDDSRATLGVLAIGSAVLFMLHHSVVKSNLFLVSGVANRLGGTYGLAKLFGMIRTAPLLAALFLVTALSLAGIPPLSGFWAKLGIVLAGLSAEGPGTGWVVFAALATGLCTLISMVKIWNEAFWKEKPTLTEGEEPEPAAMTAVRKAAVDRPTRLTLYTPIAALGALTVAMGVLAGPVFEACRVAARHVLEPAAYVEAVDVATPGELAADATGQDQREGDAAAPRGAMATAGGPDPTHARPIKRAGLVSTDRLEGVQAQPYPRTSNGNTRN